MVRFRSPNVTMRRARTSPPIPNLLAFLALTALAPGCITARDRPISEPARPILRGQNPSEDSPAPALPPPLLPAYNPAATLRTAAASPSLSNLSSIARNRAERLKEDETDFPDIRDKPGARYGLATDQYDRFLFPWAVNLIHEDLWLLERDPAKAREARLKRSLRIDIRDPDPDTANFPNGAYTLPKGRVYIENSPIGFYGPSKASPRQYNWEYLFRYGLTSNLEFRIFSNGLSVAQGPRHTTGYAPLAFDFKVNFWEENLKYHIPAVGLEVYITTTFGSPAFNGGTQPSLNLLLDHTLPFEVNFEHNFSMSGRQGLLGESLYEFGYSWSFQRQVVKDFDIFTHGFYNAGSLPRFGNLATLIPQDQLKLLGAHPTAVVVGGGAIWTVNNRLAVFGSYNFGLTKVTPATIALMGFALAF